MLSGQSTEIPLVFRTLLLACLVLQIGCTRIAANHLVHPSDTLDSIALFGLAGERWTQLENDLFSWQGLTGIDQNSLQCAPLFARKLPAGIYPHRYHFEQTESGFSIVDFQIDPGHLHGARVSPAGSVVLLHGWGIDSSMMLGHGLLLAEAGFDVYFLDLPGHGRSPGDGFSWGYREPMDVLCAMTWLQERMPSSRPLILYGQSTGAMIALGAANLGAPVDGVVALSAPADVVAAWEWAYRNAAPGWLRTLVPIRNWTRVEAQVNRLSGGPLSQDELQHMLQEIRVPILYLHGQTDRHVPHEHSLWLHENSMNSELHLIPDRSHVGIVADRDGTLMPVLEWLNHFEPPSPAHH